MHLKLEHPYLSIHEMPLLDLPDFAVVIGRNGVGKTQFLDAIAKGHISVMGIPTPQIEKYDITTFRSNDSPSVSWGHCAFAERTAELYLVGTADTPPVKKAESIFLDAVKSLDLTADPDARSRFEQSSRQAIRQTSDFACFSPGRGNGAVSLYCQRVLEHVIAPLRSRNTNRSKSDKNRTCNNDSAVLISLAMKLAGRLPHELDRADILRAAHYEGGTIANGLSQVFTRYKVEQYSWAHTQSEATGISVQQLMSEYRDKHVPPWILLGRDLDMLRSASDDTHLFDFAFSDPESDKITFANYSQYSFQAVFRNRATGENYSIKDLSSGEKILMALCLATFNQRIGRNQPRLLLLDELDSVLHPSMVSALLSALKKQFVSNGTRVVLATHSVTTVSILGQDEIYRVVRNGRSIDIRPTFKRDAVQELSEGLATIDTGLKILSSARAAPVTILTEGHNAKHLKKWASFIFGDRVQVFEDLPTRTGKDQLFAYGQLLSKMNATSHFLIVWDCDAKGTANKLAAALDGSENVTAFAFDRRTNALAMKGIENMYEERILLPYSKIVLDAATGTETNRSFDSGKKSTFADYIFQHGTVADFKHFDDLQRTVADILNRKQDDIQNVAPGDSTSGRRSRGEQAVSRTGA